MSRRIRLVDVFGSAPLAGNPLAVVVDAEGLSDEEMLRFTRWMNLSETTFLLPPTTPEADYRVRIFTLGGELPFAGHPTLGSCHAWLAEGGTPRREGEIVQECGVGLVRLRRFEKRGSPPVWGFEAPPLRREGPLGGELAGKVIGVLGIEAGAVEEIAWADNGPPWIGVLLRSAEEVLALDPDPLRFLEAGSPFIGVVGPYAREAGPAGGGGDPGAAEEGSSAASSAPHAERSTGPEAAWEVRSFFPDDRGRMVEDPVTGSLNASLAQWLIGAGRARPPYGVRQGARLGRDGWIGIEGGAEGSVWITGTARTVMTGTYAGAAQPEQVEGIGTPDGR